MSRRTTPLLVLALLGALTLASITVSVHTDKAAHVTPPTTHPSGRGNPYGAPTYGFGGYTVDQVTNEVGAQWRVPAIATQSSEGNASTWIAVENENRQFIQIGTVENKTDGVAMYGIFWSDVAVSFHPQQLLEVNAGDLITFKMVQVPRGWRLSFDDLTEKTPETVTIPYGAGSPFLAAQWMQEDPTIDGLSSHLPYPSIGPTTFAKMSLNQRAPTFDADLRQVLSTADGVYLIPSKVTHDQFTLKNATGPALQYLRDIFAFNAAIYPLSVDLFYKKSPTTTVRRRIVTALVALKTDVTSQTWPRAMYETVKSDVKEMRLYLKLYRGFSVKPTPLNQFELSRLESLNEQNIPIVDELRHQLGLPPVS